MDPLSITASILTVIGAAEATRKGIQRLRALKHVQGRLDLLNNEITDLELLLTIVKTTLGNLRGDGAADGARVAASAVLQSQGVLRDLKKLIDNNLTRSASTGPVQVGSSQVIIRHRGFLKPERLQEFCAKLKDSRMSLSIALNVLTHLEVQTGLPRLELAIQSISVIDSAGEIHNSGTGVQPMNDSLSNQVLQTITSKRAQASTNPGSSIIFTARSNVKRCDPFCPCQCHLHGRGQTPQWLQPFIGVLFYQYSGTPNFKRRPCNVPRCKPYGGSARLEYRFPTTLLPWAMCIGANWDSKGRPGGNWSLRTTEYVPPSAENIYSILDTGTRGRYNHHDLEKYMDTHAISPYAVSENSWSLLDRAIHNAQWGMAELLLRKGADIHQRASSDKLSPAMRAWRLVIHSRQRITMSPVLESYLDEVEPLDTLQFTVAHRIVTGMLSLDLEDQLSLYPHLANGTDVFGRSPLFYAVRSTSTEDVTLLLDRGSDVDVIDISGETVLHEAARNPNPEFCRLLCAAGARLDVISPSGVTPLIRAVSHGNVETVLVLLESGADPNISPFPSTHDPALVLAAVRGYPDILEILCQYGADVNVRAYYGLTAVLWATRHSEEECLRLLIEKGARLDIFDERGESVLDNAAAWGSIKLMKILTEAGIHGLPMDSDHLQRYWRFFGARDTNIDSSQRHPIEEERAAFQELLDSIRVVDEIEIDDSDSAGDSEDEQFEDAQERLDD